MPRCPLRSFGSSESQRALNDEFGGNVIGENLNFIVATRTLRRHR